MARSTNPTGSARSSPSPEEPRRLVDGKSFHAELQDDFIRTTDGKVIRERSVRTPAGKWGRIDVTVEYDGLVNVVEFKRSDWDAMAPHRIGANIRRYIRQLWRYIEGVMEEGNDVAPGIVFAHVPKDPELKRRIERAFEEECITVAWEDETAMQLHTPQKAEAPKSACTERDGQT